MSHKRGRKRCVRQKRIRRIVAVAACAAAVLTISIFMYQKNNFSIELKGEKNVEIGLNGVYEEQGAKAVINGKDVTDDITIEGEVDPSKPGEYTLTYRAGSLEAVRNVTVSEQMNPKLEIKGEEDISVKLGEPFKEPGYTAADEKGNDITGDVQVSYDELNKAGTRKISYTVKDEKGRTTRVYRNVNVEPNKTYETAGLPICMYHYVYDENNPPEDLQKRYGNYISVAALSEELKWLNEQGYYYPSWQEVRDYIDGKLVLPEKSIVLCFDDGAKSFLENGIPVLEKYEVPATCFMITSSDGKGKISEYKSDYVSYESHSHNMHRGGGNIGHGGIFPVISEKDGLSDLKESIDICGSGDAFAYPFGDYNERCVGMVEKSGFLCAVTTEYGKAKPGDDPLLLPRVRMTNGQSLKAFIDKVKPL